MKLMASTLNSRFWFSVMEKRLEMLKSAACKAGARKLPTLQLPKVLLPGSATAAGLSHWRPMGRKGGLVSSTTACDPSRATPERQLAREKTDPVLDVSVPAWAVTGKPLWTLKIEFICHSPRMAFTTLFTWLPNLRPCP